MFIYSQASANWMVIVAAMCMGLGFGNFYATSQTIAIKNIHPSRIGVATATYFIFMDIGNGLGPYILGYLIELFGFQSLYIIIAIVTLSSIPLYYFTFKNQSYTTNIVEEKIPQIN